jgi:hypothetical protein
MFKRRLVGVSILLAWLVAPAVQSFSAGDPHDSCSGHVCQCQRHCPPKKPAATAKDCHGNETRTPPCELKSRCHHETAPASLAVHRESIPTAKEEPALDLVSVAVRPSRSQPPAAGHTRIDPRPPRLHSPASSRS